MFILILGSSSKTKTANIFSSALKRWNVWTCFPPKCFPQWVCEGTGSLQRYSWLIMQSCFETYSHNSYLDENTFAVLVWRWACQKMADGWQPSVCCHRKSFMIKLHRTKICFREKYPTQKRENKRTDSWKSLSKMYRKCWSSFFV